MDTISNFGVLSDSNYTPCSMNSSGKPLSRRACNECRRKKTRCDMRHPKCSLCSSVGTTCNYRGQHRQRVRKRSAAASSSSIDTAESGETRLSTSQSPFGLDGVVLMDDIDTILYNLRSIDDLVTPFSEPITGFGSFGAAPGPGAMPIIRECFPTPLEPSQIETEINSHYTFSITPNLAEELIDLYFEKVQGICPIFTREKFEQEYLPSGRSRGERFSKLSPVAQFVLNGMFALSARYSSSYNFEGLAPHCRDRQFAKKATELWESIQKDCSHSVRTLQCLQGLILLAFNCLQSGPSEIAWNLTGTCVRLAYDLDLHTMDADKIDSKPIDWPVRNQQRWELLEEKRRAWWTIWEMDTFSSTVSSRPYGIDSRVVRVLLPVSDQEWIKNSQARSVSLGSNTELPWQRIVGSSNQSERAWFLVCLAVLRRTVDTILSGASIQELQKVEDIIGCAFLALPFSFYDLPLSKATWQSNVVTYNWMACSLIALNWARSRINFELHERLRRTAGIKYLIDGPKPARICLSIIVDVHQLTGLLSPQAMSVCSPFIFCAVVGLGTAHVPEFRFQDRESQLSCLYAEHIRLVLCSVGRHWPMGRALLEVVELTKVSNKYKTSIHGGCSGERFVP